MIDIKRLLISFRFKAKATPGIATKGATATTPFKTPSGPPRKKPSPYISPPIDSSESGESVDDPTFTPTPKSAKRRLMDFSKKDTVRSTKGKAARTQQKVAGADQLYYEERGAALQYEATKDLTEADLARDIKLSMLSKAEVAKMSNEERQAHILIKLRKFT